MPWQHTWNELMAACQTSSGHLSTRLRGPIIYTALLLREALNNACMTDCISFRHNIWRECWVDGLSSITSHDNATEATMTGKRKREDIEEDFMWTCLGKLGFRHREFFSWGNFENMRCNKPAGQNHAIALCTSQTLVPNGQPVLIIVCTRNDQTKSML